METMIICYSYHHGNTKKIADVMAEALNAEVVDPHDVNAEMIDTFDLIGFGSGIAFGKHYKQIREVVDALPVCHKNAFIFSTRGRAAAWTLSRHLESSAGEEGMEDHWGVLLPRVWHIWDNQALGRGSQKTAE